MPFGLVHIKDFNLQCTKKKETFILLEELKRARQSRQVDHVRHTFVVIIRHASSVTFSLFAIDFVSPSAKQPFRASRTSINYNALPRCQIEPANSRFEER